MTTRAVLLALAASLEATAAELTAKAAAIRAGVDATATSESGTVTLEEHMRRTGQNKRQARQAFAAFERRGFAVVRLGRAIHMGADEWSRAVEAANARRELTLPSRTPPASNASLADELLDAHGAVPTRRSASAARARP